MSQSPRTPPPPIRWPGNRAAQAKPAPAGRPGTAPPVIPPRPPASHVVNAVRSAAVQPAAVQARPAPVPRLPAAPRPPALPLARGPVVSPGHRPVVQCRISKGDERAIVKDLKGKIDPTVLHFNWANRSTAYALSEDLRRANFATLSQILVRYGIKNTDEHLDELAEILADLLHQQQVDKDKKLFSADEMPPPPARRGLSWLRPPAPVLVVAPMVLVEAPPHLEDFHKDTETVLQSHDPQNVRTLVQVNGSKIAEVVADDAEIDGAIETPDKADVQVTSTKGDGEVSPLKKALKSFVSYMATANKAREEFTVALSGPYGPCNGCKKRIRRFMGLWQGKARELLKEGVQARLIVTYMYSKAPQVVRVDNYYGWPEDERLSSPYIHTDVVTAVGTKPKG